MKCRKSVSANLEPDFQTKRKMKEDLRYKIVYLCNQEINFMTQRKSKKYLFKSSFACAPVGCSKSISDREKIKEGFYLETHLPVYQWNVEKAFLTEKIKEGFYVKAYLPVYQLDVAKAFLIERKSKKDSM